jgi:DHA1 family multidrug resistance protein-like MFS transporter
MDAPGVGGRHYVWTFVSLFVATAVALVGIGIIAPILPLYAKTFAASKLDLGIAFAAFPLSRAAIGPLVGRLSDRIGRRRMILVGLVAFTIVSFLYTVVGSLWHLGLLRLVQGAASMLVTPIAQAYVGDITPRARVGLMTNAFYSSMFVGVSLGPLIGGWVGETWSHEAAFVAMGILSVMALLMVALWVPADHGARRPVPFERRRSAGFRELVKLDSVKGIMLYFASRGFWRQGMNSFYPLYAAATFGFGEANIGYILSAYFFGGAVLQIPFGYLADRFRRMPQIVIGALGGPALLIVVPFVRWLPGILGIMFAIGALSALARASMLGIRTEIGKTHGMGALAGLHGSSFAAGQVIGPPVSGLVADGLGLFWVFPLWNVVGLATAAAAVRWFRNWRADVAVDPRAALSDPEGSASRGSAATGAPR